MNVGNFYIDTENIETDEHYVPWVPDDSTHAHLITMYTSSKRDLKDVRKELKDLKELYWQGKYWKKVAKAEARKKRL